MAGRDRVTLPEQLIELIQSLHIIQCSYCGKKEVIDGGVAADDLDAAEAWIEDGWTKTRGHDKVKCPTCNKKK